jgi:hypothetical protein
MCQRGCSKHSHRAHESTEATYTQQLTDAAYPALSICLSHMQGIYASWARTLRVGLDEIEATCTLDANALGKIHDRLRTYRTARLHL